MKSMILTLALLATTTANAEEPVSTGLSRAEMTLLAQCQQGPFGRKAGKVAECLAALDDRLDAESRRSVASASADAIRAGNPVAVQQTADGDQAVVANPPAYPPMVGYYGGGVTAYGGFYQAAGYVPTPGGWTSVDMAYADAAATATNQATLNRKVSVLQDATNQVMVDLYGGTPPPAPTP